VKLSSSDIGDPVVAEFNADACAEVKLETGQTIDHADYAVCDCCNNHVPPYYSSQKPVEVRLR